MENHAPVAPNFPPHSFQIALGSSVSPAHSHQHSLQSYPGYQYTIDQLPELTTTNEDDVSNNQNVSDLPSLYQQKALLALKNYDNRIIFAWLTGLRSFRKGHQNWFQPCSLFPQQLEAISALKDCTESLISTWLELIRYDGQHRSHYK